MPRMPIGFAGPTSISRSTNINDQFTLNLYPVVEGEGARARMSLHPTPGLAPLFTAGLGPCRSQGVQFKGKLHFVSGNNLISMDSNLVISTVGTFTTSYGRCGIVAGRNYLMVVDGAKGYSWDGSIFARIVDPGFPTSPEYCAWQDGYFIVNQAGTDNWQISLPDNPTGASFTGSISGATLTVTAVAGGELSVGQSLGDSGSLSANTVITALGTGAGGVGTYTVNISQTVASESMTASSWNALEFAVAQAKPDVAYRPESASGMVYLFGEFSTQAYEESGNALFPFDPIIPAGVFDYGCAAPDSVAKMDQFIFWLAKSEQGTPCVVMCQGLSVRKISTPDLDYLIGDYVGVSDAQGFCHRQGGHTFYVLTFPSAQTTFVYDLEQDLWHNRRSYGLGLWRPAGFGVLGNRLIVGDYASNQFYQLDFKTYTDNGGMIERIRRAPIISAQNRLITFSRLEVVFQGGAGVAAGQGSDPKAILQWSDDGGHTWSNEIWAPIGQMGQYKNRAIWNALGWSYGRIFQLTVTDPVFVAIAEAFVDVDVEDE